MRMMVTVKLSGEAANRAFKDGSLVKTMEAFMQQYKPEAAYFATEAGHRTAHFFISMADSNLMPAIAEPFFLNLNAHVDFRPVMNIDDLQAGLKKVQH